LTDLNQIVAELENRLLASLAERDELLRQRDATNEVLQVINASSGDLAPVFDAILERAMRLCEAQFGLLATYDDGQIRTVAARGVPPAFAEFRKNNPPDYGPGTGPARILAGERVVHIADLKSGEAYRTGDPNRRAVVDLGGARTVLLVPLLKNEAILGYITVYRKEVRLYSDKQIHVLQNFADQAVIAIENVRLFNETKEALERQTATADILKVIASSPSNLQPVFDAIAHRSNELLHGHSTTVFRLIDDLIELAAFTRVNEAADAALRAAFPRPRLEMSGLDLVFRGEEHDTIDAQSDAESRSTRDLALARGFRGRLVVPLKSDRGIIGAISITRKEPGAFAYKDKELLRTFADQAVIAIENVRLFDEVQAKTRDLTESLQQQTATSEVLQIISSSPGSLAPVFDKMLENATRVCGAEFGSMILIEGGELRQAALYNVPQPLAEARANTLIQPHPQGPMLAAIRTKQAVQIEDLRTTAPYLERSPNVTELADLGGARTAVVLPMLREDEVIGAITIYRQEIRPFTDKQVDLLANFGRFPCLHRCRLQPSRSPTSRSRWSRTLQSRPSLPSKIPGCSMNCANAPMTSANPCSSRLRPPMCSR
jgi:GAF domain-containing protein